jgi:hypothetical protein
VCEYIIYHYRLAYEVVVNTVRLCLHHHSQYYYDSGALHRNTVSASQSGKLQPSHIARALHGTKLYVHKRREWRCIVKRVIFDESSLSSNIVHYWVGIQRGGSLDFNENLDHPLCSRPLEFSCYIENVQPCLFNFDSNSIVLLIVWFIIFCSKCLPPFLTSLCFDFTFLFKHIFFHKIRNFGDTASY